MKAKNY